MKGKATMKHEVDLTKKENWTPLMVHIHRSRLIVGVVLGFMLGFSVGVLF